MSDRLLLAKMLLLKLLLPNLRLLKLLLLTKLLVLISKIWKWASISIQMKIQMSMQPGMQLGIQPDMHWDMQRPPLRRLKGSWIWRLRCRISEAESQSWRRTWENWQSVTCSQRPLRAA